MFLWGPTIVALLMGVSPVEAAHLFVIVSLTGMIGRTIFSLLPQCIGRRRCGEIMGYGIAASLGAAGLFFDQTLFGYPAFVVLLVPRRCSSMAVSPTSRLTRPRSSRSA